mmetsp:Transcript_3576/g.10158  ORF Transcript_3576/g.10158 Transcript_3576/m.10158 type:complete len:312 (+) Transcript_3576:81-1016(+)
MCTLSEWNLQKSISKLQSASKDAITCQKNVRRPLLHVLEFIEFWEGKASSAYARIPSDDFLDRPSIPSMDKHLLDVVERKNKYFVSEVHGALLLVKFALSGLAKDLAELHLYVYVPDAAGIRRDDPLGQIPEPILRFLQVLGLHHFHTQLKSARNAARLTRPSAWRRLRLTCLATKLCRSAQISNEAVAIQKITLHSHRRALHCWNGRRLVGSSGQQRVRQACDGTSPYCWILCLGVKVNLLDCKPHVWINDHKMWWLSVVSNFRGLSVVGESQSKHIVLLHVRDGPDQLLTVSAVLGREVVTERLPETIL